MGYYVIGALCVFFINYVFMKNHKFTDDESWFCSGVIAALWPASLIALALVLISEGLKWVYKALFDN